MRILAIDQGTSGTKAVVVDPERGVLAAAERALRPDHLPGGGVEQDPSALLASVLDAGRRAVARSGGAVDVVALANQGETVLAWDRTSGEPLSPAVVWQDRRAQGLCRDLDHLAGLVARRTGLVLDPYFSAPKMAWLRRGVTRAGVVTTTDTWLVHHLTGAFVTDASTASRSLLLDLDELRWDGELLDVFDLAGEELPAVVRCDEVVGTTGAFGGDAPVGGLVVDQQAALAAQGCLTAGEAKCTFGTGAFFLANAGASAVRSASGLTTSVAWSTLAGTDHCLDGQVYTAASAVRWMRDLGLVEQLTDLDRVAAADSGGALCVPALAGLAAPWWRPGATAALLGLTLSTGRGHLVRAVLEGLAAQVAELATCLEADLRVPLAGLRVDGGLTGSAVLVQVVADVLQVPVQVSSAADATVLGAAAMARLALEPALGLPGAVLPQAPPRTVEPAWSPDRAADFRHRWRAAVDATTDHATRSSRTPQEDP